LAKFRAVLLPRPRLAPVTNAIGAGVVGVSVVIKVALWIVEVG
jgi:hypothetical protein